MPFSFFGTPKDKTKKTVIEKKPKLLMHTSTVAPEKMFGLKPVFNRERNRSYVFATDNEKLASIYTLQPFFDFRFGKNEYAIIITGNNHNLLNIDKKFAYIYFVDSKNFNPKILEDGSYNHEWTSIQEEYVRKDIPPKKVIFTDILRMGVQVFWVNKLDTLVEIDKEMAYNGVVTGEQKIEYLKEQTNWKPDKVMYINQFRDICPIKYGTNGMEVDYNKQVGNYKK